MSNMVTTTNTNSSLLGSPYLIHPAYQASQAYQTYTSTNTGTGAITISNAGVSICHKRGDFAEYIKNEGTLDNGEFYFDEVTETLYMQNQDDLYAFPAYKTSFKTFREDAQKRRFGDAVAYFN